MKIKKNQNFVQAFAINIFFFVAITISPWYSYDSFNIPKITLLVLFGGVGIVYIIRNFKSVFLQQNKKIKLIVVGSIISYIITFAMSDAPFVQQFYGREGRSNGLLTYISLIIILLIFSNLNLNTTITKLNYRIALSGVIIISYSYLQVIGIDPFKWNTPNLQMFSTLGNPNFLSSFVGLALVPIIISIFKLNTPKSNIFKYLLSIIIFLLILNLIYLSRSYQGFFVVAGGILTFLLIYAVKIKNKIGFFIILAITIFGFLFSLAGLLNSGPLSRVLYKASITSRGDFFRSAFEMGKSNWASGVGFDSFGDYYLEFRDINAANRSNGEFTDTAHNYFLDIFANFGIFFLLVYLALSLLTLISFVRLIKEKELDFNLLSIFIIWLGVQLQSLISPTNFIFSILIFSISGLLIGRKNISNNDLSLTQIYKSTKLNLFLGLSISISIMLPLIQRDHAILSAYNGKSAENVISAMDKFPKSIISYNRTILILEKSGLTQATFEMARKAIDFNPRSSLTHYIILTSALSTFDEKVMAYKNLINLDPNNEYIRKLQPK